MKTTKILLFSSMLTSLIMLISCTSDDPADGRQSGDDKGVAVIFHVSNAQREAQDNAAFGEGLAVQSLTLEDLTSQKLSVAGANDACLIETTVAGIHPVRINDKAQTRATTLDHFSSIGYRGTATGNLGTTVWFYNEDTTPDGILVNPILWSWEKPYGKFFAVAPRITGSDNKLKLSPADHSGTPYVDFEVEPDVKNQKDLMTACSGEVHYAEQGTAPETNLCFHYALTAVRFKVGQNLSWNKTISKVEIINAKSKGRYTLPTDAVGTGTWSELSDPQTFTLDGISVSTSEAVNNIIMGKDNDNYVFYMIPQSLDGVSVKIHFADGSTPITANLSGTWKPGTTKTYALSQDTSDWDYQLHVTSPAVVDYVPQPVNYTVQSYREDPTTHTQQPVPWKVVSYQVSTDGGTTFGTESTTKPAWLTALSIEKSVGGTYGEEGTATLETNIVDLLAAYNKVLQDAPTKGTPGSYYNLSNATGGDEVQNTANSYLISAPGYYRIPLVYGNAIKDGSGNPSAYKTSNSCEYILQNFKDHNGVNIDSPWITQTNGGSNIPDGAKIVWTDQSGIVEASSLSLSSDRKFVQFHVPADKIKNGNAVIAVTKGDVVVWSWHLWFDHDDVLNTIPCTNYQNKVYKFTKQTLGFAYRKWDGSTSDKPRVVRLKVEQTIANGGTKQIAYIDIKQNTGSVKLISSTLYQWGRKDAMPGTDNIADGTFTPNGGDNMSIQNGIRHPETFYTWGSTWSAALPTGYTYENLWSMDNTTTGYNENTMVKTIYDPCPAGFHLPTSNAFTGFTTDGQNDGPMNVNGAWDDGWHFNNKITSPDATIYFPLSGYRYYHTGSLVGGVGGGFYWSAVPAGRYYGCCMYFHSDIVNPKYTFRRSIGFAVRPVKEE
ncbi:fimbrillin family protein [Phocaeicola oris]|uniref:fimbrillin family protein n=1 Tax=Phocaeicola oris TaxID=2896850 RepID=UPI00234F6F40|nr:fimbrillin family protein [Phocaeicola oris]MCE2616495.1 fimbrillin family protein [Phocaeicola oris]